jgi:hypothetical protein
MVETSKRGRSSRTSSCERWSHDWRIPIGQPLLDLVDHVASLLDAQEEALGARQRKRKEADARTRRKALGVVCANLALAVVDPPSDGPCIAVRTGKDPSLTARYHGSARGDVLRLLLDELDRLGLVSFKPSMTRGTSSTLTPMATFAALVRSFDVTRADIGRDPDEEVIILRERSHWEGKGGRKINYLDTDATCRMREQMQRINAQLDAADIAFIDDGLGRLDPLNRRMRRHFATTNGERRFDRNGRLFGGFWQNLPKERRASIRIDGEPIAVLDYSSMFTRLAYAKIGKAAPEGDLYAIPGLGDHRAAVKLLVNTLFFDDSNRRKNWPGRAEVGKPRDWSVPQMRKAIKDHHPAIAGLFGSAVGFDLMHTESEILVAVLEELLPKGVVALGLHDGLMVKQSADEEARKVMMMVAETLTGTSIPVTCKPLSTSERQPITSSPSSTYKEGKRRHTRRPWKVRP